MGDMIVAEILLMVSIMKVGTLISIFKDERSMIGRRVPSFFGTEKRME